MANLQNERSGFTPLEINPVLETFISNRGSKGFLTGFTFAELLIVIAILAIAAMITVPMLSSGGSVQVRSAANMIAADLEYAKSMAIGTQQNYAVVFDAAGESYEIKNYNSTTSSWEVIDHPVRKGFDYVVNFSADGRLAEVDITNVDFDSSDTITFDSLGCPYSGTGTSPLTAGQVVLQGGGLTLTVTVEPVTGFISISE